MLQAFSFQVFEYILLFSSDQAFLTWLHTREFWEVKRKGGEKNNSKSFLLQL